MTTITILNESAVSIVYKAFFYECSKKEAELKFSFKNKGGTLYFRRRTQKQKDKGFYIAQNRLYLFDIKFGQMYRTGMDDFNIKGYTKQNTKGKTHNMKDRE